MSLMFVQSALVSGLHCNTCNTVKRTAWCSTKWMKEICSHLTVHLGREYVSREKKLTMVNFLIFVQKNVSTIRFQEIKIRPFRDFEKKAFFSLFLMRKRLSSGQKWFLRPYFSLIRGMFVFRSGLRFSLRALESRFLMRKSEKKGPNSNSLYGPI